MNLKRSVIIILTLLAMSTQAWARCHNSFEHNSQTYCMDLKWQKAEVRPKGIYMPSDIDSPYLNPITEPSEKRVLSKAHINVWLESDPEQKPLYLPELNIFPYMVMLHGHSHGARAKLVYDDDLQTYVISQIAFQEMADGCWQIRFKLGDAGEEIKLMNIDSFSNLDALGNFDQSRMCDLCATAPHH